MKKFTLLLLFFWTAGFAQDLSQNLLLDYRFDGNANDASPNGYDASPFNVTYTTDRFGIPDAACHFNGVDSHVNFPNLLELKPQLPVSFSFWIKYESTSYQNQVVFNTSMEDDHATSVVFNATAATNQYVINWADGSYIYGAESRRSYVSNSIVDTNQWHFITIVVTSETDMQIFVDCIESGGVYSGFGGTLQYSANPGCLGRHDRSNSFPADYFLGSIDDFRYWDKALTQADINKICDEELSVENISESSDTLEIYTNPADEMLYILCRNKWQSVVIFNTLGQKVFSGKYQPSIDVSNFASGIYLAKVSSSTGTQTKKILIR